MAETPVSGHVAPGFDAVRAAFEANFAGGAEQGAGFAAILDGEAVVDLVGGWADRAGQRPWGPDTLAPVFSTTKGVAALVMASLLERHDADYETPVSALWPDFAARGKQAITIGQMLSHQAGLPGFRDPIDPDLWLDPPAMAARLAEEPPMWPPGEGSGYHPLTWGYLVGELARRLSGRTLGSVLREEVCGPADIDFHIGLPASEHDRCADMLRPKALPDLGELNDFKRAAFLTKWAAPNRGGAIWREIEIPSANGHGGALSVARLYQIYAQRGAGILRPETFRELTRRRCLGEDRVVPFEMDFAAGVFRNNNQIFGPNTDTLGHSGWGGSMAFGDPDRGLSAAYVMNRQSNKLMGDPRASRLIDALYDCL